MKEETKKQDIATTDAEILKDTWAVIYVVN